MAFWKRFTSCISSHATSISSRFEDPILKTERALPLLKDLRQQSFDSLAEDLVSKERIEYMPVGALVFGFFAFMLRSGYYL